MNPLIYFIAMVIDVYTFILIFWIILSWLIAFKIINAHQPLVYRLNEILYRLTEPVLRPIRRYMPDLGGIDISPIVLILLLNVLEYSLVYYF